MSEEKYQFHFSGDVQGLVIGEHNNVSIKLPGSEYFEQQKAQAPSLPIYHIPHRRNLLFTGREHLLQELRENLVLAKSIALTQPQAISGLGGIGKTQIALEYAYLYRNEYQAILWINSSSEEGIISDLIKIAERLSLQVKDEHDHIIVLTTIKNWLENNTDWLLIFDNVEDLLGVNNILPANNAGHVIVTTRIQATGTIAQSIIVEKMNENEAVLFLLRRAKVIRNEASLESVAASDITKAKEIVNLLDSLPLALDQAGAYIEETACGLAGYLERYQQQQLKLLGRRGNFPSYHPEPVTTTWSLSFEKIEQTNPLVGQLASGLQS
jgi:NB-ARC domain